MSRRHRRFIPVTLVLPAQPPTQDEIDRREPSGTPSEWRALETIGREIKLGVLADSDALRPPRSWRGAGASWRRYCGGLWTVRPGSRTRCGRCGPRLTAPCQR
jgi:hypothetical protein